MVKSSSPVVLALLIISTTNSCAALKCFQCNSFTDPSCETEEPMLNATECDPAVYHSEPSSLSLEESTVCLKLVTQVFGVFVSKSGDTEVAKQQKEPRVTRQCGHLIAGEESLKETCVSRRNGGSRQLTCVCSTRDGCNGAEWGRPISLLYPVIVTFPLMSRLR